MNAAVATLESSRDLFHRALQLLVSLAIANRAMEAILNDNKTPLLTLMRCCGLRFDEFTIHNSLLSTPLSTLISSVKIMYFQTLETPT